jgi:hypothetical protein
VHELLFRLKVQSEEVQVSLSSKSKCVLGQEYLKRGAPNESNGVLGIQEQIVKTLGIKTIGINRVGLIDWGRWEWLLSPVNSTGNVLIGPLNELGYNKGYRDHRSCSNITKKLLAPSLNDTQRAYILVGEDCFCMLLEHGANIQQPVIFLLMRMNDNFSPLDPWAYCYGSKPNMPPQAACSGCTNIKSDAKKLRTLLDNPFVLGAYMRQTPPIRHRKIFLVPLGINSFVIDYMQSCQQAHGFSKPFLGNRRGTKRLLYVNQSPQPLRQDILEKARSGYGALENEYGTLSGENRSANYVAKLQSSVFVLSPPGLGEDCYRTSEILISGGIPVIADGFAASYLEMAGLPHVRVANWSKLTATGLLEAMQCFAEHVQTFNYSIFRKQFWIEHIQQKSRLHAEDIRTMQKSYTAYMVYKRTSAFDTDGASDQASGMRCSMGHSDKNYRFCESAKGYLLKLCVDGSSPGTSPSDECLPSALRECALPVHKA